MRKYVRFVSAVASLCALTAAAAPLASAAPPVVTIDPSPTASYTSAEISGEVDTDDKDVYWYFQYSKDPLNQGWSYGPNAFSQTLPAGEPSTPVAEVLTGLEPGVEYEVRLVAYVTDFSEQVVSAEPNPTFTTLAVATPTVTIDPVTVFDGTTATFTGTIDPNAPEAAPAADPKVEAAFESHWHFECVPACPGLSGTVAADNSPNTVEANATGLEPNTTYEVTLVASNAGGQESAGPESFKSDGVAPVVKPLHAGYLNSDGTTLAALVNPKNSPVTYQFEWGTDTSYGNLAPASPASLGAEDNAYHVVTTQIAGLTPGTTYHFRLLATNTDTSQVTEGEDRSFTIAAPDGPFPSSCPNAEVRAQQGSVDLPDCRAYEKVSPVDKNGANATELGFRASSPDGSRFNFKILGAPPGSVAGKELTTLLATRDPLTGWTSSVLDPPIPPSSGINLVIGSALMNFSSDRSKWLVQSYAKLTPDAAERTLQWYVWDEATGTYQLIRPRHEPPSQFQSADAPAVAGNTADFNRFYFQAMIAQTDDPVTQDGLTLNTYEWVNGQGVRLIGILPDGSIPPGGSLAGAGSVITGGSSENAFSRDGSRAFFHTVVDGEIGIISVGGQIYVRDDHGTLVTTDDTTTHVSASQRSTPDPAGPLPAIYWTAEAEHGSKVLFTSCEQLTDDSTADAAADPGGCPSGNSGDGLNTPLILGKPGRDLYLYDVDSGDLTDLTTSDPDGADVIGVVGASDDLSHIYFVAGGELDPTTTAEQSGARNLYLWHNGDITFIATMDSRVGSSPNVIPDYLNWAPQRGYTSLSRRVTPDGGHLLFISHAPLTGYDNTNPGCGKQVDGAGDVPPVFSGLCAELYLYDAATDNLSCLSCATNGAAVTGEVGLALPRSAGGRSSDPYARNLLEDGSRAYFNTPDALVTEDSNGKVDVYQWVRDGVGGCQDPTGCVSLISSGKSASDSFFADASEGGHDVFFTTYERLTGTDGDDFVDMYDARVDGGFPESDPPLPPCIGDACQAPPGANPADLTPGTGHAGSGNPWVAKRCKKGRRLRQGRCVAKRCKKGRRLKQGKCVRRRPDKPRSAARTARAGR